MITSSLAVAIPSSPSSARPARCRCNDLGAAKFQLGRRGGAEAGGGARPDDCRLRKTFRSCECHPSAPVGFRSRMFSGTAAPRPGTRASQTTPRRRRRPATPSRWREPRRWICVMVVPLAGLREASKINNLQTLVGQIGPSLFRLLREAVSHLRSLSRMPNASIPRGCQGAKLKHGTRFSMARTAEMHESCENKGLSSPNPAQPFIDPSALFQAVPNPATGSSAERCRRQIAPEAPSSQ